MGEYLYPPPHVSMSSIEMGIKRKRWIGMASIITVIGNNDTATVPIAQIIYSGRRLPSAEIDPILFTMINDRKVPEKRRKYNCALKTRHKTIFTNRPTVRFFCITDSETRTIRVNSDRAISKYRQLPTLFEDHTIKIMEAEYLMIVVMNNIRSLCMFLLLIISNIFIYFGYYRLTLTAKTVESAKNT